VTEDNQSNNKGDIGGTVSEQSPDFLSPPWEYNKTEIWFVHTIKYLK